MNTSNFICRVNIHTSHLKHTCVLHYALSYITYYSTVRVCVCVKTGVYVTWQSLEIATYNYSVCIIMCTLTLNQPRTHKCVQSLHKSIIIYMGVIILGPNTLYINFCLIKQIPMASKRLRLLLNGGY